MILKIKNIIYSSIFLVSSLSALVFSIHENNSKTLNAIMASGTIQYNDVEKLDMYLSKLPTKKNTAIYFDSPGGNLYGGIRLGTYFKKHKIKTVVQGYKICASACALAFLGGTDRHGNKWMSSTTTSKLGFHAFSSGHGKYDNMDNTQKIVSDILKYGNFVNAPMEIFVKQFETPSSSIYWFDKREELNFGIKVWDIEKKRFLTNSLNTMNTTRLINRCKKFYNGKSCYILGKFYENVNNIKKAVHYYELACEFTGSKGCYESVDLATQVEKSNTLPILTVPKIRTTHIQENPTNFITKYFNNIKRIPYLDTWNMLSYNMKQQTNLSKYTNWWEGKVRQVIVISVKKINNNTVQARLKYYLKNGKIICSKDTFSLQKHKESWLIDNQKIKTISCNNN